MAAPRPGTGGAEIEPAQHGRNHGLTADLRRAVGVGRRQVASSTSLSDQVAGLLHGAGGDAEQQRERIGVGTAQAFGDGPRRRRGRCPQLAEETPGAGR
ncbi:MAG: hypothetical protein ACT4QD_04245 [Acidobacteriota bacterium]